jgi:hypothetical protein
VQPRVLLSGLAMPESPRWRDGRLWFSNWGTRQIVAVDLDGHSEVVGQGPDGLGWATNWLPDGRMLITGPELIRVEPDGSRVRHADLSHISPLGWSEITVDGRGNVYVNTINFDFAEFNEVLTSGKAPGKIALVTPDGEAREVANELAFPNGMVVTPDNKTLVVAESFAARLTAFDIEDDGGLSNRRTLGGRSRPGRHLPRRGRLHLGVEREHIHARLGADSIDPGSLARRVEELGFESLFLPEHTHIPVALEGAGEDESVLRRQAALLDPFVGLTWATSATERLLLGTGVCLIAFRDPIVLAKEVATLGRLSGGRFLFGVGAGSHPLEASARDSRPCSLVNESVSA